VTAWQKKGVESVIIVIVPGCPSPLDEGTWCDIKAQDVKLTNYRSVLPAAARTLTST
jgi:hypothetical protein